MLLGVVWVSVHTQTHKPEPKLSEERVMLPKKSPWGLVGVSLRGEKTVSQEPPQQSPPADSMLRTPRTTRWI